MKTAHWISENPMNPVLNNKQSIEQTNQSVEAHTLSRSHWLEKSGDGGKTLVPYSLIVVKARHYLSIQNQHEHFQEQDVLND